MAHPEWAAVGETVAVYRISWSQRSVTPRTVERHTKTQVILDNGDRYVDGGNGYTPYGRAPGITTYLLPMSDPRVRKVLAAQGLSRAVSELRYRANRVGFEPTSDEVAACRTALTALEALM